MTHYTQGAESDLLKVNLFGRTKYSLIRFFAEVCVTIAYKNIEDFNKLFQIAPKLYKKEPVLPVCVQKEISWADSRKFSADMRPSVRAF